MFYDLCVPWSSSHADIQRTLAFLSERTSKTLEICVEVDEMQFATMSSPSTILLRVKFRLILFV